MIAGLAILISLTLVPFCDQDPGVIGRGMELGDPNGGPSRLQIMEMPRRIEPPKLSPKEKLPFFWVVQGLGATKPGEIPSARFRVFSQIDRESGDPSWDASRMLMRLWDMNLTRLKLDHAAHINNRVVDLYICSGGKPGGEQLIDTEDGPEGPIKVNTMYIYDVASFSQPLEMAREIAHEYGHASLPPVGGFTKPESWANGYLGESLYLKWLRDEIASGRLEPDDAMGASLADLDAFVKRQVAPLLRRIALGGPNLALLAQDSEAALWQYVGLALYAETLLPQKAFARSLVLTGSTKAQDYASAIVTAAAEVRNLDVRIPRELAGRGIWVPLGSGKLTHGKLLKSSQGWAQVVPKAGRIRILNPQGG